MANSTVNPYVFTVGAVDPFNSPAGAEQEMTGNPLGHLRIAASLPDKTELTRMGNCWTMRIATASAFTLVAALPTTRAEAILYNAEPASGKCYVIDSMWMTTIVTTTALTPISLLAQLVPAATMVAPTHSATTTLISSRSGKAAYSGLAKRAVAVTTCFTDLWEVVGTSTGGGTASIATGVHANLFGGWIVPPGAGFGMNAICGTAVAASGIIGCTWYEVQLALG